MDEGPEDLLRELAEVAAGVGPALQPAGHEELLQAITATARAMFRAEACSLALLDEARQHLRFYVASGRGADLVVGQTVGVDEGIAGWVLQSGQGIAVADVPGDARFARRVAESAGGYVPRRILAMPLETDRAVLGVIEVLDSASDRPEDMELLALFARLASLAIESAEVFGDLARVLLTAVAAAAPGARLSEALASVAAAAPPADDTLATLARHFAELQRLGDGERATAAALVGVYLDDVRRRQRRG